MVTDPYHYFLLFLKSLKNLYSIDLFNIFNDHHILVTEQFGFRQTYSMDNAIFQLLNQILNTLNTKKTVGGTFCDLSKAFDSVNHGVLFSKLRVHGITGQVYDLMKSYLQDRHQQVVIHSDRAYNCYWGWGKTSKGVPQGFILAPFLFLVYVNGLTKILNKNS